MEEEEEDVVDPPDVLVDTEERFLLMGASTSAVCEGVALAPSALAVLTAPSTFPTPSISVVPVPSIPVVEVVKAIARLLCLLDMEMCRIPSSSSPGSFATDLRIEAADALYDSECLAKFVADVVLSVRDARQEGRREAG